MASIDKRVVEMKFDNAAFERGVSTTMSTLDKLKDKLNFTGAARGFSDIGAAANKIDMNGVGKAVDDLSTKFGALQVAGVTALATVANRAVDAGINIVKSLTIGPIGDGFSDYNAKLTSVRTVANSTGKSITEVGKYFNVLDTYADQTVYRMSDMTSAFAKFTNAGISIQDAIPAIKGIGNLTALAGQGADSAQIAYYNLSQSLASGFLTRIDYKSLELANVATKGFRTELINAALAAGTLKKSSDGVYHTFVDGKASKKAFTEQSLFTDGLQEQFVSAKILTTVLNKYGDAQTELGKKALHAAQDIKTLPQLLDTMKAAVGSQFTHMFETMFGNVDQATTLFTGLSNVLSKIFVSPLISFNNFLSKLKEIGALGNFVDGFKNIFKALGEVFHNVAHAFREIFPPSTGKGILEISKAFKDFTQNLLMGNGTAGALMKTFEGVFAVFKIAIDIISGIVKAFFGLFGVVGTGGVGATHTILAFTSVIGVFLMHLQQWLEKTGAIKTFFEVLTSPLRILRPLVDILVKLAEAIASLLTGDFSGFKSKISGLSTDITSIFSGMLTHFTNFFNIFSGGLGRISTFFSGLSDRAKAGGNGFVATIAGVIAKVTDFLSRFSGSIGTRLASVIASMHGMNIAGKNFLGGFGSGAVEIVMDLVHRLSTAFGNLKDSFNFGPQLSGFNSQASSVANGGGGALVKIGNTISSIWKTISGLAGGIGSVLSTVVTALGRFFGALGGQIKDALGNLDMTDVVAILNTGMLFLVMHSFMNLTKNIGGAFKNIGGSFGQLTSTLKSMQSVVKTAILLQIAAAVGVLVLAMFILAKIDARALGVALAAVAALFAEMAGMMYVVKKIDPQSMVAAGTGMVAMSTAILILAHAIKILGGMDPKVLTQGTIALTALMAALAGMAYVLNGMKGILAAATGLLILSVALTAMAATIALYAAIPFDVIKKGIEKMAIALIALGIAMSFFPPGMIAKSIGITILAAALLVLTGSLTAIGLLPHGVIKQGIIGMAIALGILVISAKLMRSALPGAAALLIMAAAIWKIAPALALLGVLPMGVIKKGLEAIAGIMLIFVAAMYLLTPVVGTLGVFAAALLILGVAVLAAGAGFSLFAGALALLTVVGAAGFAVLAAGIISLIALFPLIAQQIGYAIITFAAVIKLAAPKIAEAAGAIVMAFVNEIAKRVPEMGDAGLRMILGLLKAIRNRIHDITNTAIDIMVVFLTTLKSRLPNIIQAGIELIIAFLNGLATGIRKHKDEIGAAGVNLGSAMIDGLISGLSGLGHLVMDAIHSLGRNIVKWFKDFFRIKSPSGVFSDLGLYLIQGLANGFAGAYNLVKDAVEGLAHKLPGWMKKVLGIKSPSTVFHELGGFVGEGFANGIEASSDRASAATKNMGTEALGSIKSVISNISDSISTNIDATPTIRPVLDLSHVEENAGKIGSMLDTGPILTGPAYASAQDASSSYGANKAASLFDATQTQKALQALAATKQAQPQEPRPVEFHIGTIEDGDSLLRRARSTNKMLTLAEGGDSTQVVGVL